MLIGALHTGLWLLLYPTVLLNILNPFLSLNGLRAMHSSTCTINPQRVKYFINLKVLIMQMKHIYNYSY